MSYTVVVLLVTGLIIAVAVVRAVRRELRSIIEVYRSESRKVDEEQQEKPMFKVYKFTHRS